MSALRARVLKTGAKPRLVECYRPRDLAGNPRHDEISRPMSVGYEFDERARLIGVSLSCTLKTEAFSSRASYKSGRRERIAQSEHHQRDPSVRTLALLLTTLAFQGHAGPAGDALPKAVANPNTTAAGEQRGNPLYVALARGTMVQHAMSGGRTNSIATSRSIIHFFAGVMSVTGRSQCASRSSNRRCSSRVKVC